MREQKAKATYRSNKKVINILNLMLVGVLSSSHKYSCRIKGKASSLFYLHNREDRARKEPRKHYVKWSNKSYLCDLDLYSYCFVSLSVLSMISASDGRSTTQGATSTSRKQYTCECETLLINSWC